jgi:predicted HicB family RNase H-like nuclease
MVQVNVRVPPELHAKLVTAAFNRPTTVTAIVTEALQDYFNHKPQGGKGK